MCAFFFFFKKKTAYEMRISDWSSDVCSSDLIDHSRLFSRNALKHGDISFHHLTRLEGSGKALVRLGMACQQQATARVPVEPMHGQRPALEPEGEAGEMVFKAHSAIFRRIDRKPGRLVE